MDAVTVESVYVKSASAWMPGSVDKFYAPIRNDGTTSLADVFAQAIRKILAQAPSCRPYLSTSDRNVYEGVIQQLTLEEQQMIDWEWFGVPFNRIKETKAATVDEYQGPKVVDCQNFLEVLAQQDLIEKLPS